MIYTRGGRTLGMEYSLCAWAEKIVENEERGGGAICERLTLDLDEMGEGESKPEPRPPPPPTKE